MQAQTLESRKRTTPWLALVLAVIFAAAIVVGVQVALRGNDVTTVTPAAQTVDQGVAVGGTPVDSSWSFHRLRGDLTAGQVAAARAVLRGAPRDPALAPTVTRINVTRPDAFIRGHR